MGNGVVDDKRDTMTVQHIGKRLDVGDTGAWIGHEPGKTARVFGRIFAST